MPKSPLKPSLDTLQKQYPAFNFVEDDTFYWSAQKQTIYFNPSKLHTQNGIYRLLHELGHAISHHKTFHSGIALLSLEVEAWEKAAELATQYGDIIPQNHIEDCLNSYRDWLHRRSTCPKCSTISIEYSPNLYRCFNCLYKWQVSGNQLLRCYRKHI